MPNWKKVIVSGSAAQLTSVTSSYGAQYSGSVFISAGNNINVGQVASSTEASLVLGPPPAAGSGEGGQISLQPASGFTSGSFIDMYQTGTTPFFRILRGSAASSDALLMQLNTHTKQLNLPAYTGASSFTGTATANLAVDSSGNVITVSTSGGSVFPYTGNAVITGSLTVTQALYAQANGAMYLRGGDDAEFWDINVANTVGIYGQQDATIASIKLGSGGGTISGKTNFIGIATTTPTTTLDVNGTTFITGSLKVTAGITGSLSGTSSYATTSATASTITTQGSTSGGTHYLLISSDNITSGPITTTVRTTNVTYNSDTKTLPVTSSWATSSISASFASTASYINPLNQSVIVTGSYNLQASTGQNLYFNSSGQLGSSGTGAHITMTPNANTTYFSQIGYHQNGLNVTPGGNTTTQAFGVTVGSYPSATIASFSSGSVTALTISGSGMRGTGSFNYLGDITATSFTGSLSGSALTATSASYATTSSYVNPLVQNVSLNGSLTVTGSTANRSARITDTGFYLSRTSDGGYVSSIIADGNITYSTRNSHIFQSNGSTLVTIPETGNVLIGTTSDVGYKVDVNGTVRFSNNLNVTGSTTFKGDVFHSGSLYVTASANSSTIGQFIGARDGFIEFSVRNTSASISASSDIAVYSDAGTATANYIDMGINSSTYSGAAYDGIYLGKANDAYLFNDGGHLSIGNANNTTASGSLFLFAHPNGVQPNAGLTITGSKIGINKTGSLNANLDVSGSSILSGSVTIISPDNSSGTNALVVKNSSGYNIITGRSDGGVILGNSVNQSQYIYVGTSGNYIDSYALDSHRWYVIDGTFSPTIAMVVKGNGAEPKIGIRNSSPNYNLDVSGSSNITNGLTVTGSLKVLGSVTSSLLGTASYATMAATASYYAGSIASASYATTASYATSTAAVAGTTNYVSKFSSATTIGNSLIYDNGTNVGIGTTSPSYVLHTYTGATSANVIGVTNGTQELTLGVNNSSGGSFLFENGNNALRFGTNGSEQMRISNTGLVGIGHSSPGAKLHVGYTDTTTDALIRLGISYAADRTSRGGITWHDSSNTTGKIYTEYDGSVTSMVFGSLYNSGYTSNQTMIIRGNGRVGIGVASPNGQLSVNGGISGTPSWNNNTIEVLAESGLTSAIAFHRSGYTVASIYSDDGSIATSIGATEVVRVATNYNVGIGTTTPSYKLSVVGKMALNDSGNSVFIGDNAGLSDDATANINVGIGTNALQNNVSGSQNVAIGNNSLTVNSNSNNTGVGSNTLQSNTIGFNNTGVGSFALWKNIDGTSNAALGPSALLSNTSGSRNIAIGSSALRINTTGSRNVAVGTAALYENITGSYNIAVGDNAGRYFGSGTSALSNTSGSIFIGSNTRANANISFNEIVIGNDLIGLGSNTVVLGNDNVTTTALKGNVGIGTTSPSTKLHSVINDNTYAVNTTLENTNAGSNAAASISFKNASQNAFSVFQLNSSGDAGLYNTATNGKINFFTNSLQRMTINASGDVGIGTTSPGYKLDVNGNTNIGGYVLVGTHAYLSSGNYIYFDLGVSNDYSIRKTSTSLAFASAGNFTFNKDVDITGTLTATVKSFIIDHPTKPTKKLQYGVLEGPEHSVYIRGKLTGSRRIELPDYWHALVDEDSITVNLTAIGRKQELWVEEITDTYITIGSEVGIVNCFYTVFAERKDVDKLITEFDKE